MGSLRARLFDRNRYSKRYPLVRAPKRMTYQGDEYLAIEVGSLYFDNTATATLTYEVQFPDASYQLIALLRDGGDVGGPNVNIYIDGNNTNSVQATIKASAPFTGYVDILAVRLGS